MKTTKLSRSILAMALSFTPTISAQVQTIVPPVIPNAKPVTVEHIKIHGAALEGNLEGDAVDRDVIVFLPPSYAQGEVSALSGCLCLARLLHRSRSVEP